MPISGGGGQPKSWSSRASEKGRSRSPRQTCDVSERGNRKTWHCYGGPSLGEIHIACEHGREPQGAEEPHIRSLGYAVKKNLLCEILLSRRSRIIVYYANVLAQLPRYVSVDL